MMKGITKIVLAPLLIVAFIVIGMVVNSLYFDATQKMIIFVTAFLLIVFFALYSLWR